MTAQSEFINELYTLAAAVAKEAKQEGTKFDQKVDALKALTPYYAAIVKGSKGRDEDTDAPGNNFGAWRDRLSVVEGGADGGSETGIPAGSRRGR
jgi:hypothetical protein